MNNRKLLQEIMDKQNKKQHLVDLIGFIFLGLVSLGYVIFTKPFAELHLQFKFLNFPIFAGEISLLIGLILFCVKYLDNPQKLTKRHYLIISYFAFVIIKALYGYFQWSPLALRHAALFYYPVFAIFGYVFYRRDFFDERTCLFLLVIISAVLLGRHSDYCVVTLAALGFILIAAYPHKTLKFLMLLMFLVIIPYKEFFPASRMMIVSNFLAGLYFAGTLPAILKVKKKFKFALMTLIGGVVIVGLLKFADHSAVKSIIAFKRMAEVMRLGDEYIAAHSDSFKIEGPKEVKVYNPDESPRKDPLADVVYDDGKPSSSTEPLKIEVAQAQFNPEAPAVPEIKKEVSKPLADPIKTEVPQVQEQTEAEVPQVQGQAEAEVPQVQVQTQKKDIQGNPKPSAEPIKVGVPQVQEKISPNDVEEVQTKVRQILSVPVTKITNDEKRSDPLSKELLTSAQLIESHNSERGCRDTDYHSDSLLLRKSVKQDVPDVSISKKEDKKETGDFNNNAAFRLFIWRDMLVHFKEEKPLLFGFDFGRPFRSRSLEMLNWGSGDWARDGWIGAHNSYLEIIYRTGIVGILLILSLYVVLFKMIKKFILTKSFTGVLLCGIIINWFAAANFLLIFELPFTAIPIWTIYGVTLAYCYKTQEENHA